MGKKIRPNSKTNPLEAIPGSSKVNSSPSEVKHSWLIWAIIGITFVVFYPSLKNNFVNWDDDRNVYENPLIQNQKSVQHVKIFQTSVIGNYNPLSIWTLAMEHHFFGMDAKAMHRTNLILHLICVFFAFKLLNALGLNIWFAAFGALLFGIHPLRVESVAWITERKDVLFGVFFLSALYLYVRRIEQAGRTSLVWIFLLFAIGLFAKIQMVSLPLSMLAVDYLKNRQLEWKLITEKWAFFLGSLAFGVLGIFILGKEGSLEANETHAGALRILIGSYSLITYLIKWLVPYMTVPLYPYPEKLSIWHYFSLPAALGLLYGLYVLYRKNQKELVFGFSFFLFNIFFLLQILGAGQGYLADRFSYIAYFGLFYILAFWGQKYSDKKYAVSKLIKPAIIIYATAFAFLSFEQCKIWKNSDTLWTHVIKYYNNTPLPFNNRANHYRDLKQFDKALEDYSRAIQLKAGHGTYNSRAKLYFQRNEDQKALEDYNIAIQKMPTSAEYYTNRGAAYAKLNQMDKALEDLTQAVSLDPNWKVAYLNRSIVYHMRQQYDLALKDIDSYLKIDPSNADLWYEGGVCQRILKNFEKSIQYFDTAIRLNPKLGLAYFERGNTFKEMGQLEKANADFNVAQSLGIKLTQ